MVTNEEIQKDIVKYERKILRLRCELMDIPAGSKSDRRKNAKKREKLQDKILHVQELKQMAQDALEGKFEKER